ncbi:sensor histidine kinase [Streptomyces sp. NBC_01304]|uniref:sensor histidine kinase n=1 Tax=Streptomyces sp. NBC_01304 TaxID=2903818 RepID=UPI002E0D557E|nr:histidine kinase [Streptomyces sp. NBC_01304]
MTEPQPSSTSAPDHADQARSAGAVPLTQHIQRVLQRIRDFDRRRPLVWDLLFTAFFVVLALIDWGPGGWQVMAENAKLPPALTLCMALGLSLPLLWRRRTPMAVLAVMSAVALVNSLTGTMLQASLLTLFVLFNVALRRPLKTLWWASALVFLPYAASSIRDPAGAWDRDLVPALWYIALVALLGIAVRTRRDYTSSLMDRARQLEVERDQQAQLAAAAERTRIAREMHDIIGHNLSVITGLADGGAYAAKKNPERAGQALHAISTTSREALAELRRLLGVLRDDESGSAELAPQPGYADLNTLVDGVRSAGLPIRTDITGNPETYPEGLHLTVYRVVQEALTNILKHAGPGAQATVEVLYAPDGVRATVTDTGHPAANAPEGRGITGMRERTALYEGTLEAGPMPTGGWQVRLHLPAAVQKTEKSAQ